MNFMKWLILIMGGAFMVNMAMMVTREPAGVIFGMGVAGVWIMVYSNMATSK